MRNQKNKEVRKYRIGEVYMVEFHGEESEQRGRRPGLVVQNDAGNDNSPNLIMVPLTSVLKKREQPTHVFIKSDGLLWKDSIVLCENPACVSKTRVGKYVTTISDKDMELVSNALLVALGIIPFLRTKSSYRIRTV